MAMASSGPIKGVLFDKDGTLLDFEATYAPACALVVRDLAGGNEAQAALLAAAVDFDLGAERFDPASVFIAGCTADIAEAWAPLLGAAADGELAGRIDRLFERYSRNTARLFAGVPDTLSLLSAAGLKLGIATNDAEANARAHARVSGLDGWMDFFAGYDSGHGAKPGPGMVAAFARFCGCEPGAVIMVGDSLHDMAAARACGAHAVAVATGPAGRDELAPHADVVIDSLAELAALPVLGLAGAGRKPVKQAY